MLGFLTRQEKDPLELEKEQLEKHLAFLQRQSKELEKRLQNHTPSSIPIQNENDIPKINKVARFVPDEEFSIPPPSRQASSKEKSLKFQKRLTRNRVIKLAVLAIILLIIVIRTLF